MIVEVCVVSSLLVVLAAVAYFIFAAKPFSYKKSTKEKNTHLKITANRDIPKLSVHAKFGREKIAFERKKIKKGQTIDFVYPSSDEKSKIILEGGSGKDPRVFYV